MSEKVKFYYYNLVNQDATVITPSTEDAFFPASNLKHDFSTKVYRSTAVSANVVFDFITAQSVDSILVKGHFIDGFGFTGSLTIEANSTDVWTSPAYSSTISVNSEFNIGIKTLATAQSYRYWRISGTGASYFELSNIFIGSSFQPQRNVSRGFTFENRDLSVYKKNKYAQRYIDKVGDQLFLKGRINLINKTNVDAMFDFIDYVGKKNMFWVVLNESEEIINEKERLSGTFYFNKKPVASHVINGLYNFPISLEEAI